jgi:spermidine synthase
LRVSGRKIDGTVVRHCRDEFGEMIVADDGVIRSLYFEDVLQSCIRLDRPAHLIGEYNQAMMSSLLFKDEPRSVLLVGLGGCSLANFLLTAFPSCAIDVVEIREKVIDLARDYFLLRTNNANLTVFHAPGQDFVRQTDAGSGLYDIILVDAFDEGGPAAPLLKQDFLESCRRRMAKDGVFAVNLWSRPKDDFPAAYAAIREAFGNNALKLAVSEFCWNTIVFGFTGPAPLADLNSRRPHAKRLGQKHGINFPKYLKYLYWQNFC